MSLRRFYNGSMHTVDCYVSPRGESVVEAFLDALQDSDRKKMVAVIQYAGDHGPPTNREKCHKVEGTSFWGFKTHGQRLFWRWLPGGAIALMHGFPKNQDRTPRRDLIIGQARFDELDQESRAKREDDR